MEMLPVEFTKITLVGVEWDWDKGSRSIWEIYVLYIIQRNEKCYLNKTKDILGQ